MHCTVKIQCEGTAVAAMVDFRRRCPALSNVLLVVGGDSISKAFLTIVASLKFFDANNGKQNLHLDVDR